MAPLSPTLLKSGNRASPGLARFPSHSTHELMLSGLFCILESSFNQLPLHLDSHSLHWHVCRFFPEWHNSLLIWILLSGFLSCVFSFLSNFVPQCHSTVSQIRPVCSYPSRLSSSNASPKDALPSFSPPRGFSLRTHSHHLALIAGMFPLVLSVLAFPPGPWLREEGWCSLSFKLLYLAECQARGL